MAAPIFYLDPGTGSLLLFALVGIFTTLFFALRGFWYRVLGLFSLGESNRQAPDSLPDLVFHSEGGTYWAVFEPVIEALAAKNIPCAYITPDETDPAFLFSEKCPSLTVYRPGGDMVLITYMNRIRTRIVVTTTPHLDIYMLKRSPHVEKYYHLFHAPTSVDFYEIFAFDRFDGFLTTGSYLEKDLRYLRELRGLPEAEYYPVGCTYYDLLVKEKPASDNRNINADTPVILYAPTWGDRSSIIHYGKEILEQLTTTPCRILFRPHPQFYTSHKAEIEEIEAYIHRNPRIELDRNHTPGPSMNRADLLICDFSGILFDFAFLHQKPVILLEQALDLLGFEGQDIPDPWDIRTARFLSSSIPPNDLSELLPVVRNLLNQKEGYTEKCLKVREQELVNFGKAGEAAAQVLESLIQGKAGSNEEGLC